MKRENQIIINHENTVLSCALFLVVVTYIIFFIVLPQSWTFNTDYGLVQAWGLKPFPYWQTTIEYIQSQMAQGRFFPLEQVISLIRQKYLPMEPVYFRAYQMILGGISLFFLNDFLKQVGILKTPRLMALLLVAGNLSMKEWIVLSAAAEVPATTCLMVSLSLWSRYWRWTSLFFFICAFLFKESFFITLGALWVLEYFLFASKRSKRIHWPILGASIFAVLIFLGIIFFLPRVYTAGRFSGFSFTRVLSMNLIPPLKSFGPAWILLALSMTASSFQFKRNNVISGLIGLAIAIPFSVLLMGWYYHTGWGYLNIVTPFGWAIFFAALWDETSCRFPRLSMPLIVATSLFVILLTFRGSHARWKFAEDYKKAADVACLDSIKTPGLRIFTNNIEGAGGLMSYLKLNSAKCFTPPLIEALEKPGILPLNLKPPFIVLRGLKWADMGFDENQMIVTEEIDFGFWQVFKNIPVEIEKRPL